MVRQLQREGGELDICVSPAGGGYGGGGVTGVGYLRLLTPEHIHTVH